MSERELRRIEVLQAMQAGRQTVTAAARFLGISRRQAQRLAKVDRSDGAAGLRHQGRGRRSNRALSEAFREPAVSLVRERYGDFGPTLAAEIRPSGRHERGDLGPCSDLLLGRARGEPRCPAGPDPLAQHPAARHSPARPPLQSGCGDPRGRGRALLLHGRRRLCCHWTS